METDKAEQLKAEMQQWYGQAEQLIRQIPPNQLYAAVGIVLLTVSLFILVHMFNCTISNTVVLMGLSGSGKTTLFYQLRDGSSHQGTVTSMEPNDSTFVLYSETSTKGKIKPVHVVDVPGHSRLRSKLEEYLYDILTKASVVKKNCNKVDKVTAHTKEFIRKQLEKEIDNRASRTALSAADITNEFTLGGTGETFAFSQCHNKVTVAEASGLTGDISQLEQFIREHVKP
ncbi:hypothetical protein RJ639_017874 [Escallonia herrerae]|uniref:Signal recognition particle receptor subunit beta n=1 Tax=Escallonia herrerae TaxID=1293975 RepID=A0AA88V939_9ASTE|nr:hypothetical protein RJ639_017874 [Escallonia herrerae]